MNISAQCLCFLPTKILQDGFKRLSSLQTLGTDVRDVTEEVRHSKVLLAVPAGLRQEERVLLEDTLDCLKERLSALGSALTERCEHMRARMHELTSYQVFACFMVLSYVSL